jgi:hypothetical protein
VSNQRQNGFAFLADEGGSAALQDVVVVAVLVAGLLLAITVLGRSAEGVFSKILAGPSRSERTVSESRLLTGKSRLSPQGQPGPEGQPALVKRNANSLPLAVGLCVSGLVFAVWLLVATKRKALIMTRQHRLMGQPDDARRPVAQQARTR